MQVFLGFLAEPLSRRGIWVATRFWRDAVSSARGNFDAGWNNVELSRTTQASLAASAVAARGIPVIHATGSQDRVGSVDSAKSLAELLGVEVTVIEGGHGAALGSQDLYFRAVDAQLRQLARDIGVPRPEIRWTSEVGGR